MKIAIEIKDETIENLIECADIRYWCSELEYDEKTNTYIAHEFDETTGEVIGKHKLDIERGVQLAIERCPRIFVDADAEMGDLFVQYAALGEYRYA